MCDLFRLNPNKNEKRIHEQKIQYKKKGLVSPQKGKQ